MHEVTNQQFLVQCLFFFKVKLVAFGLIFIDSHFGHLFAIIFVKSYFAACLLVFLACNSCFVLKLLLVRSLKQLMMNYEILC